MTLKARLQSGDILVAPGAYDALTAKLVTMAGFEAVYLSGAGVSYSTYGAPDLGMVTATQMVERVQLMADATDLPIVADGDNGYGNAINVYRTVRQYERAGASAIQLEDQIHPKRCGHLSGKRLIPEDEMIGKLHAATDAREADDFLIIARTDARSVLGLDAALERAVHYLEAGADVLFVESPRSINELRTVVQHLPETPLMANMVEGGKTPLVSTAELETMGYALVIYPNSLTRHFVHTAAQFLQRFKADGTTASQLDVMSSFQELNHMLGLQHYQGQEAEYLPDTSET